MGVVAGVLSVVMVIGQAGSAGDAASKSADAAKGTDTAPKKVVKTNQEWAKALTRPQFLVTRMKQTEPPFTGKYLNNHARGTYHCVCCEAPLFSSKTKFESGTGWPSFWRPVTAAALDSATDYDAGEPRIEVKCSTCDAHLGHVFNDGPAPTGLRYCINSVAIKFAPDRPAPKAARPNAKAKSEPHASKAKAGKAGSDRKPPEPDAKDSKPSNAPPTKDAAGPSDS